MSDIELSSLRLKVREQATRLQDLEKFRRLSEDPLPPHSLPSSVSSPSQLLDSYSSLYSRLHEVLKENSQLESTLRGEMIESEKQRAYIELLKQTLEGHMSDIGLTGSVEDLFARKEEGVKDLERMKSVLRRKEGKVIELQTALSEYQNASKAMERLKADLTGLKSELDLRDASQTQLESSLKQLESDNDELTRELHRETEAKNDLEQQLKTQQDAYDRLKTLFEHTQKEQFSAETRITALENELKDVEMLRNDFAKMKSDRKEVESQLVDMKREREQMKSMIDGLKSTKNRAENECKVLSGQLEVISQLKNLSEGQAQSAKESLIVTEAEISHLRAQLSSLEVRFSESESQREFLQGRVDELASLHRNAQSDLKEVRKDNEFLILETRRLRTTHESEVSTLSEEIAAQRRENDNTAAELEAAKKQIAAMKDETWLCQQSLKALERTRASEEHLRKELMDARKSLSDYRGEISALADDRRALFK